MTAAGGRASALALLAALAGCSAITKFDLNKSVEATAALCSDGIDNDEDGLTDCQDWKCLGQKSCCDVPTIVLDEAFQPGDSCPCPTLASPSCAALAGAACGPSPDNWTSWGSDSPRLCRDGLVSCKVVNCYDVGLFSNQEVTLEAGVKLRVSFSGVPEARGRLTAALTFQATPPTVSDEACLPITPIQPVAAIELVEADDGVNPDFLLQFGDSVLARIHGTGSGPHDATIEVRSDGLIDFTIDEAKTTTGPDQVIPTSGQPVHVALYGRGLSSHITRVRLSHGARCEDQGAWTMPPDDAVPPPAPLSATPMYLWEDLAVFRPSIAAQPSDGRMVLAYSGCANAGSSSCVDNEGGLAIAREKDGTFQPNDCAFASTSGNCPAGSFDYFQPLFPGENSAGNYFDADIGFGIAPSPGATRPLLAVVSQPVLTSGTGGTEIRVVQSSSYAKDAEPHDWTWGRYPGGDGARLKQTGSWDRQEICCASLAVLDRQNVWYSGRDDDGIWRIGYATLGTDGSFTESPANPVLGPGDPGSIDQRGVSDPEVVWDTNRKLYRMWYVAHDSLDQTSICLAISTDGIKWHRYPGNPVIRAAAVGLRTIANPTVLMGDDGVLRMWVDGESITHAGLGIYELRNAGAAPM
jgi:hypothetical protein